MKNQETPKQNDIDLEPFYQALEEDRRLLEKAFETLLEMVNNEPESIKNLALLIKEEYPNLYNEIADLNGSKKDQEDTPSCCSGH
jgi:predicted transcriptional regulator